MSLIATNPFAFRTYVPSRTMLQKRQSSGGDGKYSLLGHGPRTDLHELADRCVHEERRVVVAIAATGPVDEHRVALAHLRPPAAQLELVRERPKPCASVLLHRGRDRVVGGGGRPRPRRV